MLRVDCRTVISLLVVLSGCSKNEPAAPATPAAETPAAAPLAAAPAASAPDVFKNRCTPCHGLSGKGDGPAAVALNPKPRNYTDVEWQKTVTDDQLKKTIMYGGAAVGKSAVMPSHPDLESQPEVLDGLVKIIRDFGAPQ